MRFISLKSHAIIDAALVVIGFAGPWVLGFAGANGAYYYSLFVVIVGLGLNLATNYPGGLVKLLPMKWRQVIEWTSPLPFIVVPWLEYRDAGAMPWFLTAIGLAIFANTALTREAKPVLA